MDAKTEERLALYLQEVITSILAEAAKVKAIEPGAELPHLQKIDSILKQLGVTLGEILPPQLIKDYFGGVDEASTALTSAGAGAAVGLALTKDGLISQPFQKVIHLKALEKLIDDTMGDMSAAIRTARISGMTNIQDTLAAVRADLAKGAISGDPTAVTQSRIMSSFRKAGMTSFVTSDNKNLPLDFYAMTVARTKTRSASIQGSVNRYIDAGQDLVQVISVGDSCKACAVFDGMVFSLTGKTRGFPAVNGTLNTYRLPPYHPNCRCRIRLFMLNAASPAEIEAVKLRNREFNPTKDRRTEKQKAQYANEQAKRRKANAEKKQFGRWQDALGAQAPKTLPAFRRMKRQNTIQFQQLQSEYRSNRMTDSWMQRSAKASIPTTPLMAATNFLTPAALATFTQVTASTVAMSMATTASRQAYAESLMANAGMADIPVKMRRMGANGAVGYYTRSGKLEVAEYALKENDPRSEAYQLKTLFHEFYHAQYNGLTIDEEGITKKDRDSWEETATETAAHYMIKAKGIEETVVPSYANHLIKNLPMLKKLDEFKDCVTIEDFGAVFMKYRFDQAHKTAQWKPLNKAVKAANRKDKFDAPAYYEKHYHAYIKENLDEIAKTVAGAIDKTYANKPQYFNLLKGQIESGLAGNPKSTGYELAIAHAMKTLGVK